MVKIADPEETAHHLDYHQLVLALEKGFAQGCVVPERHHHTIHLADQPPATLLLMPAWNHSFDNTRHIGVKIVNVFPGNTSKGLAGLTSTYLLYDGDTGQNVAMLDGNVLTARRTVATSALAAKYLSRTESENLFVLGSGRVAKLIPEAYQAVRPIRQVRVWDINLDSASKMVAELKEIGLSAAVEPSLEIGVKWADIVSAATLSTTPLIQGAWLQPGTHVDLIGGFTPKMREADDEAICCSAVYVDVREALREAGDLTQPIERSRISASQIRGTLAELTKGTIDGRLHAKQITAFKAVGSGLADLIAAQLVFNRLQVA